jgi:pimeloyl-ACP methyl ester carboxylesterase
MVLLTGLGDNAHVYDQFAFQFTDYVHVIGITRCGFLPSSQPEAGYDVDTRARDDIEVLRALGIRKAVFVGHSVAGSELSKVALTYKNYVDKLVYLDVFDLSERVPIARFTSCALSCRFGRQISAVSSSSPGAAGEYARTGPGNLHRSAV